VVSFGFFSTFPRRSARSSANWRQRPTGGIYYQPERGFHTSFTPVRGACGGPYQPASHRLHVAGGDQVYHEGVRVPAAGRPDRRPADLLNRLARLSVLVFWTGELGTVKPTGDRNARLPPRRSVRPPAMLDGRPAGPREVRRRHRHATLSSRSRADNNRLAGRDVRPTSPPGASDGHRSWLGEFTAAALLVSIGQMRTCATTHSLSSAGPGQTPSYKWQRIGCARASRRRPARVPTLCLKSFTHRPRSTSLGSAWTR